MGTVRQPATLKKRRSGATPFTWLAEPCIRRLGRNAWGASANRLCIRAVQIENHALLKIVAQAEAKVCRFHLPSHVIGLHVKAVELGTPRGKRIFGLHRGGGESENAALQGMPATDARVLFLSAATRRSHLHPPRCRRRQRDACIAERTLHRQLERDMPARQANERAEA